MIKFEEHEGKLFHMLEEHEIVPLKEKDTNVLVRFITHSIIGEYVMEHWLDCNQENVPIFVDSVDSDGDVTVFKNGNEHICCPFPIFEIIGTLVKDGSKEWALYQMMQGKTVCQKDSYLKRHYEAGYVRWLTENNLERRLAADVFLKNFADTMDWQIYKEPKPLLAEAKVGDLCQRRDGKWVQIDRLVSFGGLPWICYEAGGQRYINTGTMLDYKRSNLDILSTEPLAPEGTAEWVWQMAKLGIETKCHERKIRVAKSGLIEVCYNGMAYAMPLTQSKENRQYAIDKISECSPDGWQLYEPKPEPIFAIGDKVTDGVIEGTIIHIEDAIADVCPSTNEYKIELRNLNHIPESPKQDDVEKPLRSMIAEAKAIGKNIRTYYQDIVFTPQALEACLNQGKFRWWNICNWELTTREQNYYPSISTSSDRQNPTYKVGDWVECDGNQRLIEIIGDIRDLERGDYYHFAHGFGGAYANSITRKLKPSEVVIPVNISGTVRQAYNEDGTINYEQFQLLPNGSWDGTEMFISFDALDTQTRELVESLLEAQEEE